MTNIERIFRTTLPANNHKPTPAEFIQIIKNLEKIRVNLELTFNIYFVFDFSVIYMSSLKKRYELYILFKVDSFQLHDFYSGELNKIGDDPETYHSGIKKIVELMNLKEEVKLKEKNNTCILNNRLTGMFVHESIGHYLEDHPKSSFPNSSLSDSLTIVDYVKPSNNCKDLPFTPLHDQLRTPVNNTVLVKNGNIENSILESSTNGHHFHNNPKIMRMRNIIMDPSNVVVEELISSVQDGYFLLIPGAGYCHKGGKFSINVILGARVKNGELVSHIKNLVIESDVFNFTNSINAICSDLRVDGCFCVKASEKMYLGIGGPSILCNLNMRMK